MAASKYDLSYLDKMGLKYFSYQHTDQREPYWYPNEGNEAGAYLQFILDHWACLPAVSLTVHAAGLCLAADSCQLRAVQRP